MRGTGVVKDPGNLLVVIFRIWTEGGSISFSFEIINSDCYSLDYLEQLSDQLLVISGEVVYVGKMFDDGVLCTGDAQV